ncbi:MAG: response regulator transcription factor [Planctomycetota bacterium]|jgi:DNA-binding NarL/FixJ family response regulator
MQQFPRSATEDLSPNGSPYERPRVILLDEKHWSYIQRRYHISPRELEVAKLVCNGLSNKEIAESLDIRQGTVKTHIKNIYRRIHVKNKVALLLRFMADISQLLGENGEGAVVPFVDAEA